MPQNRSRPDPDPTLNPDPDTSKPGARQPLTEVARPATDNEDELLDEEDIPLSIVENDVLESVLAAREADEDDLDTDDGGLLPPETPSHEASLLQDLLDSNDTELKRDRLLQRRRAALLARRSRAAKSGSH